MALGYLNRCIWNPASAGTGDFVVSAAVTGYLTPAQAGAVDGTTYNYFAQSVSLSEWEYGSAVYTSATTTLDRIPIKSSNADALVNFTVAPDVAMGGPLAADQQLLLDADVLVKTATAGHSGERVVTDTATVTVDWATAGQAQFNVTLTGELYGLILSNDGTDPTNDISISIGKAADSTNTVLAVSASALIKRLDANWAVGTNQGMRNSGAAITDTTYHIYQVSKAFGASADFYAHTSTTVATVITALQAETGGSDYIYARRIGSIVRASGAVLLFSQEGDQFLLLVGLGNVNTTNPGTSAVTFSTSVPLGIKAIAQIGIYFTAEAGGATIYLSSLDQTDSTPGSLSAVTGFADGVLGWGGDTNIRTNTSAQARYRVDTSGVNTIVRLSTQGWVDTRGRIA